MSVELTYPTSSRVERTALTPDALALLEDLDGAPFLYGVDQGWWREVRWAFPRVCFAISAAGRPAAPHEVVFEFECSRYRGIAPLCLQVHPETLEQAARSIRPKGCGRVGIIFRTDWENGQYLYSPLDRHALATHSDWSATMPRSVWTAASTITRYLTDLHGLLNSPDYSGVVGS
jgi:hypothetical protein